jgi:hypothetical protein
MTALRHDPAAALGLAAIDPAYRGRDDRPTGPRSAVYLYVDRVMQQGESSGIGVLNIRPVRQELGQAWQILVLDGEMRAGPPWPKDAVVPFT